MTYENKIFLLGKIDKKILWENEVFFLEIPAYGAQEQFVHSMKKRWPNIPKEYIKFLHKYNGGQYDDISFLGDQNCKNGCVFYVADLFADFFFEKIPIAKDSGGDIFYINKDGRVFWVILDNIEQRNNYSQLICENFEEFMNDFCFGEKYKIHYGDNSWSRLLTSYL